MMKKRVGKAGVFLLALILEITFLSAWPAYVNAADAAADISGTELRPSELYARYAVLMDAESGRILFSKSGDTEAPMASTTKIMTCILALENGEPTDEVSVSSEAAAQPDVKLGMREGQKFLLGDLLYSLMLESHNDTAVAIAEHIGGSVQGFADMMNGKAEDLECTSTYFITPNGLDAKDENGIHHTTAGDLARIMKYCIMESPMKENFLEITRTDTHTFSDCDGNGSYICTNHNAFLKMMDGALTGKTGFTADAGYCYVGALQSEGRTFIAALLACGWPNNKGYKWSDMRKLMTYGTENFFYQDAGPASDPIHTEDNKSSGILSDINKAELTVSVTNGYTEGFPVRGSVNITAVEQGEPVRVLLRKDEKVERELNIAEGIAAPVGSGDLLGETIYTVNGMQIASYPVRAAESVEKRTFQVCLRYIFRLFTF